MKRLVGPALAFALIGAIGATLTEIAARDYARRVQEMNA